MKILFCAPMQRLCDYGRSCAEALAKLGNEVVEWNYREVNSQVGEEEANRLLAKQFRKERFDLFFLIKGESIQPKVAKFAKKMGATTVLWSSDDPYFTDVTLKLAPFFDHIFTTMLEFHEAYKDIKTKWLPLICSDDYKPLENCEETIDLSFIGSNYAPREETVKAIKEALPDLNFKVWGSDWSDTTRLADEEAPKIINASKINLVISQHGNAKYGVVNPRTFEILACRKFALVDNHVGIRTIFNDREHLAVYYDLNDLIRAIKQWLYDPQGRREIAERGYQEYLAHHSAAARMESMLKLIGNVRLEIPRTMILRGGDYSGHYPLSVAWKDKKILDIGADVGSTAQWFLNQGAKEVIAVEGNAEFYRLLEKNAQTIPDLLKPIQLWISSPKDLEDLFLTHRPDIVKIDIEGCEIHLIMVYDSILKTIPEYVVETHNPDCHKHILEKLQSSGYNILYGFHFNFERIRPWNDLNVIHAVRKDELSKS